MAHGTCIAIFFWGGGGGGVSSVPMLYTLVPLFTVEVFSVLYSDPWMFTFSRGIRKLEFWAAGNCFQEDG